jgi:hypothetical protein
MNWATAIDTHQAALARIVATLVALLGLAGGGDRPRLPRPLYRAVLRVLRPAEAAVRRLIVVAARGLAVKVSPARARRQGQGRGRSGTGSRPMAFQLFDPPHRVSPARPSRAAARGPEPRLHLFTISPLVPLFQPPPAASSVPKRQDGRVSGFRLCRRLAAITLALEDLPGQAKRLARRQARLSLRQRPWFRSPLRPGPPPGHRVKPRQEIDWLLWKCHLLAMDGLNPDTS